MVWFGKRLDGILSEYNDQNDHNFNTSLDVKTTEYPNYDVITNYSHKQDVFEGFGLLIGAGYGFFAGVCVSLPYSSYKYRRQGYRDFKLLERLCPPLMKCTALGTIIGLAFGAGLEAKRMANRQSGRPYNSKYI